MPVGDCYFYYFKEKNKYKAKIYKIFGTLDLHTHIRLKPLKDFMENFLKNKRKNSLKILEIGCGSGVNGFEIYKIALKNRVYLEYVGIDVNFQSIKVANTILQIYKDSKNIEGNFTFFQKDAISFLKEIKDNSHSKFDIILLIDVIEHIKNPEELLILSKDVLSSSGIFLVSVPTPLYPRIFGRDFHNKIGHLVDGYSLTTLDKLFYKIGFKRIYYKYNTGLIANIGCYLYYNKLKFSNKYLNFLKSIFLYPFKFLDFYNSKNVSCSLFTVYRRRNDVV